MAGAYLFGFSLRFLLLILLFAHLALFLPFSHGLHISRISRMSCLSRLLHEPDKPDKPNKSEK
jgi:hypothetical protein